MYSTFFFILGSFCRPWNEISLGVHGRLFLHHSHVVGLHVVRRKCPSDGTKARQRQLEKLMVVPLRFGEKIKTLLLRFQLCRHADKLLCYWQTGEQPCVKEHQRFPRTTFWRDEALHPRRLQRFPSLQPDNNISSNAQSGWSGARKKHTCCSTVHSTSESNKMDKWASLICNGTNVFVTGSKMKWACCEFKINSNLKRHLGVFIKQRNVKHQPPQQVLHHGRPQLSAKGTKLWTYFLCFFIFFVAPLHHFETEEDKHQSNKAGQTTFI